MCNLSPEQKISLLKSISKGSSFSNKQLLIRLLAIKKTGVKANSTTGANQLLDLLFSTKSDLITEHISTFNTAIHILCGAFKLPPGKKVSEVNSPLQLSLTSDISTSIPTEVADQAKTIICTIDNSKDSQNDGNSNDSDMSMTRDDFRSLLAEQTTELKSALTSEFEDKFEDFDDRITCHDDILYNQFLESSSHRFSVRVKDKKSYTPDQLKSKIFAVSGLDTTTMDKSISIREIKKTRSGQPRFQCETVLSDTRFLIMKNRAKFSKEHSLIIEAPMSKIMTKALEAIKEHFSEEISTNYSGYFIHPTTKKPIYNPFSLSE